MTNFSSAPLYGISLRQLESASKQQAIDKRGQLQSIGEWEVWWKLRDNVIKDSSVPAQTCLLEITPKVDATVHDKSNASKTKVGRLFDVMLEDASSYNTSVVLACYFRRYLEAHGNALPLLNRTMFSSGASGNMVVKMSFGRIDVTVMKRDTSTNKNFELIHEAAIGMRLMAARKDGVPNFAMIYQVVPNQSLVFYEYSGKQTLCNWLQEKWDKEPLDFINIFLQVFFAIEYAAVKFNFSHNDLHTQNVIINERGRIRPKALRYPGRNYLIPTNAGTAMIIDYGMSRIDVGKNGRSSSQSADVEELRPLTEYNEPYGNFTSMVKTGDGWGAFPLNDAFKLLLFAYEDMTDVNRKPKKSDKISIAQKINVIERFLKCLGVTLKELTPQSAAQYRNVYHCLPNFAVGPNDDFARMFAGPNAFTPVVDLMLKEFTPELDLFRVRCKSANLKELS